MMRQIREEEPEALKANGKKWTEAWLAKRQRGSAFQWPQWKKAPLNEVLVVILGRQIAEHCSFCDCFPVKPPSRSTVEHFKPKSDDRFAHLAFAWENLFYCCDCCQSAKREDFDEALLKPDVDGYDFARYFICDFRRGEIKPNPKASPEDQARAEATCRIYGLNENGHPARRQLAMRVWRESNKETRRLEERPYRYYLAAGDAA